MYTAPFTRLTWLLCACSCLLNGAVTVGGGTPLCGSPFAAVLGRDSPAFTTVGDASRGNHLAIIDNGYDALLLRVHLIRNAQRSIGMQTFIWTNDECGRLMMYELIAAARRGVKVRIIADNLFSDQDPQTVAFLATVHPNLEIRHYRPTAQRLKTSRFTQLLHGVFAPKSMNQRMHNKIMLVDGAALITGGRNIENTYFNHSTAMNFRDRDVLAVGPVVALARDSFEEFWDYRHSVSSRKLTDVAAAIAAGTFRTYETWEDFAFGPFFGELTRQADSAPQIQSRFVSRLRPVARVQFLADKPGKNQGFLFWGQGRITRDLADVLASARESVVIQSPYLVLSPAAANLFRSLKAQSPQLRFVVSTNSFASTDNILAYSANYRLRGRYVEDLGLEVHEYRALPADLLQVFPQYPDLHALAARKQAEGKQEGLPLLCIHAKSLVVDDRVAFVGSYNLDPRSENLNTEVGLLVEDAAFARELKGDILADASARNSWVLAKRQVPLHLDVVNRLVDGLSNLTPVDAWPLQNTTSFELLPGAAEVAPGHPDFYRNYREAGDFPGADGALSHKEIVTRLYKAVGPVLTPMM
ncbi:MAG: hypothetical protein A3K19_28220 [Lentisphaerae bacterium RIFOXYB12_FULL_65_16]|nr:MAG: hypothetical protein A3K18_17565 [Lentisphaerae bacterium RIFOXYA12_64_32]OGV85476.1 MAG: hypothetical protein A3K19_28220 [Lentisphaerae bacterium RIFOXYB12_FULL_65_16]